MIIKARASIRVGGITYPPGAVIKVDDTTARVSIARRFAEPAEGVVTTPAPAAVNPSAATAPATDDVAKKRRRGGRRGRTTP